MGLKTWLRANWDRSLGAVLAAGGVLAIVLGYVGVKDTPFPAEQVPYIVSGAILGIALVGVGLTAWLSADLRDEWHKLDRIEKLLDGRQPPSPAPTEPSSDEVRELTASDAR